MRFARNRSGALPSMTASPACFYPTLGLLNFVLSAHNYRMTVRGYQRRSAELECMLSDLNGIDRDDLIRLQDDLDRRLRDLGEESSPVSGVLEYRPYADGTLQAEVRRYYRKDGSVK